MDIWEEVEEAVEQMEREGCPSNFEDILLDLLEQSPTPPPPPSSPARPPQPAAAVSLPGGFGGWTLLGAGPPVIEQQVIPMAAPSTTVLVDLNSQPGTVSQGQNLLYQWPSNGVPPAVAALPAALPAAPSNPCNSVLRILDSVTRYLRPVGELMVCDASPPALNTSSPKKRKRHEQQEDEGRLYVKKPCNAFMLYLKEQRTKVKAELTFSGSAAVNAVVGERWKLLSQAQQAKYYEQAERERMLHAQKHPGWSSKENYGKKRRRVRSSTCSTGGSPSNLTQTPALGMTSAPPSTSLAAFAGPTEVIFVGDTSEELLSHLKSLELLLPATQPQEPLSPNLDSCTGHSISADTPVDGPPSTGVSSPAALLEPMATFFSDPEEDDLLSFLTNFPY